MSRRLLKVKGNRGPYKYDGSDGFGNRLVWEESLSGVTNP